MHISPLTLGHARQIAVDRIKSKDDALTTAVEMLEKIGKGESYDSWLYLALVYRMKEIANG